jgi:hypothetical protein
MHYDETLRLLGELQRLYRPFAQIYRAQQNLIRAFGRNPHGIGPSPKIEPEIEPEWPKEFKEWCKAHRQKLNRFANGSNSYYSISLNLASQFLRLFQEAHGPVHTERLFDETLKFHEKQWGLRLSKKQREGFKKHLNRNANKIGLKLPKRPPGRPRKLGPSFGK